MSAALIAVEETTRYRYSTIPRDWLGKEKEINKICLDVVKCIMMFKTLRYVFLVLCLKQFEEGIAFVCQARDETWQSHKAPCETLYLVTSFESPYVEYDLHFFMVCLDTSFTHHEL